jgi:hypothetical protein
MNTQNNINKMFAQRWICLVHILPSPFYDDFPPDATGAFVTVVADAPTCEEFISKVHEGLENTMGHPILEIEDIEQLSPERELSELLKDSIENLLPYFPIAFGNFYCYDNNDEL